MKNLFVVSAITQNHFFKTIEEAKEDFRWGVETCKREKIKGTIYLYKIPANNTDDSNNDYFLNCLSEGIEKEIEAREV